MAESPALTQYCRDLTEQARRGELHGIIGRDAEMSQLHEMLSDRSAKNPILVGESGVGKTALVNGLAWQTAHQAVPSGCLAERVIELDEVACWAGARDDDEVRAKLRVVFAELARFEGQVVLVIEDLDGLLSARLEPTRSRRRSPGVVAGVGREVGRHRPHHGLSDARPTLCRGAST